MNATLRLIALTGAFASMGYGHALADDLPAGTDNGFRMPVGSDGMPTYAPNTVGECNVVRCVNSGGTYGLNPAFAGPCADHRGASLGTRTARGVDFTGSCFDDANLRSVQMQRSNFTFASMFGAKMSYGSFYRANFQSSLLLSADLTGAHLVEANMQNAVLNFATLRGANLSQANLTEANLGGSDLREADLTGATLTGAVFDRGTRLPFTAEVALSRGMIFYGDDNEPVTDPTEVLRILSTPPPEDPAAAGRRAAPAAPGSPDATPPPGGPRSKKGR